MTDHEHLARATDDEEYVGDVRQLLRAEVLRLRRIEEAARAYRFAGADWTLEFLKRRGWKKSSVPGRDAWNAPLGYPREGPKSATVALAVELEMSLGLHQ